MGGREDGWVGKWEGGRMDWWVNGKEDGWVGGWKDG